MGMTRDRITDLTRELKLDRELSREFPIFRYLPEMIGLAVARFCIQWAEKNP